jgi:hypothetical protein
MTGGSGFGKHFAGPSWAAWRSALKAGFGLPGTPEDLACYQQHTSRKDWPTKPSRELWFCVGRSGGKSRTAALIAVYMACCRDYSKVLAAGEVGTLMVLAADRQQARHVFRFLDGLIKSLPSLSRMVVSRTKESITLNNSIVIEVHTASFRSVRGYSVVGAVCDEISFWRNEDSSANPDAEILTAVRPGLARVPGSLLVAISSPYARRGELWKAVDKHHGRDGDQILTWLADTASMNPTVNRGEIDRAFEDDPVAAASEYGSDGTISFRSDVESFVPPEVVAAVVEPGVVERAPNPEIRYVAGCDPAGGSGADSMVLAIAHNENGVAVLDLVREVRPNFSPEDVTRAFSQILTAYRCSRVVGDAWAKGWPRDRFFAHGITYICNSERKSDVYEKLLAILNSRRCRLLDIPRMKAQLFGLERRTASGGSDSIDHGARGHDDAINGAAIALVLAEKGARGVATVSPSYMARGSALTGWTGGADADGDSDHVGAVLDSGGVLGESARSGRRGGWPSDW